MYTVSKGPSKIVAKTRRGVSQNFDRLENSRIDIRKQQTDLTSDETTSDNTVPKPVFQGISKKAQQYQREPDEISPQHEELIKYIRDSWSAVCHQYNQKHHSIYLNKDSTNNNPVQTIVYYNDGEKSPLLHDFKPFDLEQWWGKRMFNSIIKSQSG